MAGTFVLEEIAKLESISASQDAKVTGYENLFSRLMKESQPHTLAPNLSTFVTSILGDTLRIVAARPILTRCVEAIRDLDEIHLRIDAGKQVLSTLESRVSSFEEQNTFLRHILADAYQEQANFIEAAKALQGLSLENTQDEVKINVWIRICRLYLEEDETTNAESYLNRAKTLLYKFHSQELTLTFQLCQARILDSNRKFLEASQAYQTVSLSPAVADEERNMALSKAIICAVLAPAGPQRSRALGKLYKDDRAAQLEEFGVLEKMFLDRLISPREVNSISEKLASHQLALTSDGSTVLEKAVVEHNLLGASKLYSNLEVAELGRLINLDAEKAEQYAARMLEQKRLSGSIDQIRGIVFFGERSVIGERGSGVFLPEAQPLRSWDRHVQALVEDVERVSSLLLTEIPVSA